jgi:hypothetical protein
MVGLVNLVAVVINGHYQPVAIENLGTNILPTVASSILLSSGELG